MSSTVTMHPVSPRWFDNQPLTVKAFIKEYASSLEESDFHVPDSPRGFLVTKDIFVSDYIKACNPEFIKKFGINSILSLTQQPNQEMVADLGVRVVRSIPIIDGKGITTASIDAGVRELRHLIREHSPVLVNCQAGISRSPAIVTAYLCEHEGMNLNDAIETIRAARSSERPVRIAQEIWDVLKTMYGKK